MNNRTVSFSFNTESAAERVFRKLRAQGMLVASSRKSVRVRVPRDWTVEQLKALIMESDKG